MNQGLIDLITRVWERYPHLRLCQLIGNCSFDKDLYYVLDADLFERLEDVYPECK